MKSFSDGLRRLLGSRQTQAPILGDRELEVLKILWQNEPLSAKQVLDRLPNCELSLSTMQTTLERLFRKSLLTREKAGRYYLYCTTMSRSELISLLLGDIAQQVSDGQTAPMISGFMAYIAAENGNPLNAQLSDIVEKKPTLDDE